MVDLPRSDAPGRAGSAPARPAPARPDPERPGYSTWTEDGFSGWAWFAGGLMGLVGLFQVIVGITALASTGYYTVPSRELVVDVDYSTWGWVHLVLGIVMVVTGGGLAFGNLAARVVGVALAGISALVNLAFITAAPFSAVMIIALDVFVIYAITVHGGEPKRTR